MKHKNLFMYAGERMRGVNGNGNVFAFIQFHFIIVPVKPDSDEIVLFFTL